MRNSRIPGFTFALLAVSVISLGQSFTASITSTGTELCQGDSVAAYIYISGGSSPWDVVLNDNSGEYLALQVLQSPRTVWLKPQNSDNFYIASIEDSDGNPGSTVGSGIALIVHQPTPVSIVMDRTSYLVSESGIDLVSSPSGASFSGVGISGNRFYPSVAGYETSPHHITCTYTNQFGCKSTDETDFNVLSGIASVILESGGNTVNALCDDGATYSIRGSNDDDIPGTFQLVIAGTMTPVPGHITDADLNDNVAILNPVGLSGAYDMLYSYGLDGVSVTAAFRFLVNDLGEIGISNLSDTVCKNQEPFLLVPELLENDPSATYIFSGAGVSGNMTDGYYFDPSDPDVPQGTSEIDLDYTSSNGCKASSTNSVFCSFVPVVRFLISSACIPTDGGEVSFSNLTSGKFSVESWYWDFGDPESGGDNFSALENPQHYYDNPDYRSISLTATTKEACVATYVMDTLLVDQPDVDFTLISDCFVGGEQTLFVDKTISSYADVDSLIWTFETMSGGILGEIGSGSPEDTIKFPFKSLDRYRVNLEVKNQIGCSGALSKEILLKPIVLVPATGFMEDFNSGESNWISMSGDQNMSWILGVPEFQGFTQVPGDLAWYTDLPVQTTGYLEESWVQSPCFDMSNLSAPLIQLDIMKSFAPGTDGAVIQYQDYVSEGWKTIGYVGDGLNWYNEVGIFNEPGGDNFGWGLALFQPDNKWVNAGHSVDNSVEFPYGKFRVIIATGGRQAMGNQGFAFDNFFVGERLRYSVLEYFTNSASMQSHDADDLVDAFVLGNAGSVIDLQYHMDYPGEDPMNDNSPVPPATRSFNYGVPYVPYAVLNGGVDENTRFTFLAQSEPNSDIIAEQTLEVPSFDVRLQVDYNEDRLDCEVRITCTADTFASNVQLYIAVIEREVTAYTGSNQDTSFRNVVLDMLPNATGKLVGNGWYYGKSQTLSYSWDYAPYVEDVEDLSVVAFVQNRDNGKVLQATAKPFNMDVGIRRHTSDYPTLTMYPNPAGEELYVHFGKPVERRSQLDITDMSGKLVASYTVEPGYTIQRLGISRLQRGIYMISWRESDLVRARGRVVVSR